MKSVIICEGSTDLVLIQYYMESRYLTKRRYKTKAKFDVYFSIRTPLEHFNQRREILRSVSWENYEDVQNSFKKLKELG